MDSNGHPKRVPLSLSFFLPSDRSSPPQTQGPRLAQGATHRPPQMHKPGQSEKRWLCGGVVVWLSKQVSYSTTQPLHHATTSPRLSGSVHLWLPNPYRSGGPQGH